uniref:Uncharacterized protein n=1 Tax=Strongyloides venezuelensis TaxID=75913 RepID=A0A0K0FT39_STRVS
MKKKKRSQSAESNNSKANYSENSGRNSTTNSHSEQKSLGVSSNRRSSSRKSVPSQRYSDEDYVCNKAFVDLTKSKRDRPSKINRFQQALLNTDINSTLKEVLMETSQKNIGNAPSTTREDGKMKGKFMNELSNFLKKNGQASSSQQNVDTIGEEVSTIMEPKNAINEQLIGAIILLGKKLEKNEYDINRNQHNKSEKIF